MADLQQNASSPAPSADLTTAVPLKAIFSSPELFNCWVSYEQEHIKEEDSDQEEADGILDVILECREGFEETYSHCDGLGALPRRTRSPTRLVGPPAVGEAKVAGKYEDAMRLGLKVERTRLLESESDEVEWNYQGGGKYGRFFNGWKPLVPYKLPAAGNIVQSVIDENQKRWDAAGVKVNVLGNGAEAPGIFGIIRKWFTYTDWLSLYRAQARTIFSWEGRDEHNPDDLQVLENQEHHLFDTTKYYGATEFMTIITYGRGQYGTASLFTVNLTPAKPGKPSRAAFLDIIACAKDVPRSILRGLKINGRIELLQKNGKIRCIHSGGRSQPSPARVYTKSVNKKGKKLLRPWEDIGDGWRRALGITYGGDDDDGLVATIPQMMALLHLKGSALRNLVATPIEEFETPLISVPYEEDSKKSHPGWEIKRGLKILGGPDRDGHDGDRVKVIALFPCDSAWADELLLWG